MNTKSRNLGQSNLALVAVVFFVFVVVALVSSLEKGLLASTVAGAMWVAVSARWEERRRHGFWWLIGLFALVSVIAIGALPTLPPFKSGLAVSYPVGLAAGFLLYWLLGRLS